MTVEEETEMGRMERMGIERMNNHFPCHLMAKELKRATDGSRCLRGEEVGFPSREEMRTGGYGDR